MIDYLMIFQVIQCTDVIALLNMSQSPVLHTLGAYRGYLVMTDKQWVELYWLPEREQYFHENSHVFYT